MSVMNYECDKLEKKTWYRCVVEKSGHQSFKKHVKIDQSQCLFGFFLEPLCLNSSPKPVIVVRIAK